jgi:hypothetical protein
LRSDFSVQQSAEDEGNLHQVVEFEREAEREKMGQIRKKHCERVRWHSSLFPLSKRMLHRSGAQLRRRSMEVWGA